jgi:integrase
MLKLFPPKEGRTSSWHIRGTYLGQEVNRSARTPDKATARKELKRIEREIEEARFTPTRGPVFADAVMAYVKRGGDPRFLDKIVTKLGETPLASIDQATVDQVALSLYPKATPATRNRQVYTPILAVLNDAGLSLALKRPKESKGSSRTRWLWPEEAERLFTAAEGDPHLHALLVFLTYTGVRLSEALDLTWGDVRLEESFAYIPDTKTGTPIPVHLPDRAASALRALGDHSGDDRVFSSAKHGHLYHRFRRARVAAGLGPDVSFHILRHTYATWMRRYGGLDTKGLLATGRWKDEKSVHRYSHAIASEESKKVELLPGAKGVQKMKAILKLVSSQ